MNNPSHSKPKDSTEYKSLAETLAFLINYEMRSLESEKEVSEIIRKFPIVISLVNTFGFLKDQEGAFNMLSFKGDELQIWLRKNETLRTLRIYKGSYKS